MKRNNKMKNPCKIPCGRDKSLLGCYHKCGEECFCKEDNLYCPSCQRVKEVFEEIGKKISILENNMRTSYNDENFEYRLDERWLDDWVKELKEMQK